MTTSDLDARDKSITIGWSAPSSGVATYYRIQLFDNTSQLTNKEQLSTTASIYYQNMKNGYVYDVKISARSEAYQGTQYLFSDFYVEQIKTTIQGKFIFIILEQSFEDNYTTASQSEVETI